MDRSGFGLEQLRGCCGKDEALRKKLEDSISVIRRTLALYPIEKIAFSFNGGKDSTVLLYLILAVLNSTVDGKFDSSASPGGSKPCGLHGMHSFLFTDPDDFPEVLDFVRSCDQRWGLQVEYMGGPSQAKTIAGPGGEGGGKGGKQGAGGGSLDFKTGLTEFIHRTGVQAIVLGTRSGDPNALNQHVFCPSSEGWPSFMRVNPIFGWTYHDVWTFLTALSAPYCSLYDCGYTSLGGRSNTTPNRALQREEGGYHPAYHLADGGLERAGRIRRSLNLAIPLPPPTHPPLSPLSSLSPPATHLAVPTISVGPRGTTQEMLGTSDPLDPVEGASTEEQGPMHTAIEASALASDCGQCPITQLPLQPSKTSPNSTQERVCPLFPSPPSLASETRLEAVDGTGDLERLCQGGGREATAGLLIVGDEILSGKTQDTNTQFLCQELRAIGWTIQRVVVVPDSTQAIADEVLRLSEHCEVVITVGGLGPTLDDVTMGGIAQALGCPLARHEGFEATLRSIFGEGFTEAHGKMAQLPKDTVTLHQYQLPSGHVSRFPLLQCGRNIFLLPGVPHLVIQKWTQALKAILTERCAAQPFLTQVFRLALTDETHIAASLEQVHNQMGKHVAIGSYPVTDQVDGAGILVSMDSKDQVLLQTAGDMMRGLLPRGSILSECSNGGASPGVSEEPLTNGT